MQTFIIVLLASIGGSVIQAVTGFGAGIFMMQFFPSILPLAKAAALSGAIGLSATTTTAYTYRSHIRKDLLILPAICYIVGSTLAVNLAVSADTSSLKKVFGVFLIVLSVYFLFFSSRIHLKANKTTATICSFISGIASGMFGIGGPPMVIYYLAAIEDKEEYLATIQAFFTISGLYTFLYRIYKGVFTMNLVPLVLCGIVGVLVGKTIGKKIFDRIDANTMRKVVYVFLAISGILNLIG